MHLLKQIRQTLTQQLWHTYKHTVPCFQTIETALQKRGNSSILLDHFAIIDLPSNRSGIPHLCQIFSALGYMVQGLDYLPEKQNDFLWMAEADAIEQLATQTLPQVVVADFRLNELPITVRNIIEKYTAQIPSSSLPLIQSLSGKAYLGDKAAAKYLITILTAYFSTRPWPSPTIIDFETVREANELLAWVLLFGPIPNHFTIAAHLLSGFDSMISFMSFIEKDLGLTLNTQEEAIKGNSEIGIQQGSTLGIPTKMKLADGDLWLPGPFVEFVWRYPLYPSSLKFWGRSRHDVQEEPNAAMAWMPKSGESSSSHMSEYAPATHPVDAYPVPSNPMGIDQKKQATQWRDYYTGFIAQNANGVIESLYENKQGMLAGESYSGSLKYGTASLIRLLRAK